MTVKDEFTPLHFASYKGHLDSINSLMRFGADKNALTATGLNMLHVAAQGDSASSLYLFKELGLDLNASDKRGSTALHWSCFRQSEIALGYLLAWGPDLNKQDVEGLTPLHLAVRFVDQSENTRSVRLILLRGASKSVKDNNGRTPMDLVSEIKS